MEWAVLYESTWENSIEGCQVAGLFETEIGTSAHVSFTEKKAGGW